MFGPLNGVRIGLVVGAAVAAVTAALFDEWVVTAALGTGIAAHGLGWWYLYQRHQGEQ